MREKFFNEWSYARGKKHRQRELLTEYFQTPDGRIVRQELDLIFPCPLFNEDGSFCSTRLNTVRAYRADQLEYVLYWKTRGIDPFPPTPEMWRQYFEDLANTTDDKGNRRKIGTLRRKAYAIGNLMRQNGRPSPTRWPSHKNLMNELARKDTRPPEQATPIYGYTIRSLLDSYTDESYRQLRDRGISVIGGTRGWRASTIVTIQQENVRFEERGVVIKVLDVKSTKDGSLEETATPHTSDHRYCMPCMLKPLTDALELQGLHSGPLFRPVDRWGHIGEGALSTKSVTTLLQAGLLNAGIPKPEDYSSHSYRHGVVKAAIKTRRSPPEIMLITLHKSLRGLEPYLKRIDPWYNAPSFSLLEEVLENPDSARGWRHAKCALHT